MRERLLSDLQSVGFTKNESKIYISLLGKREIKVSEILKESNVGTGKIYDTLENMCSKGIISKITKNGIKYFSPSPPGKITELVLKKEREVEQIKENCRKLLPSLEKEFSKNPSQTSVEVYSGNNGLKSIINLISKEIKKNDKFQIFGASGKRDAFMLNSWNHFAKELIKSKNCKFYFLMADSSYESRKGIELLKNKNCFFKEFSMFEFAPLTIIGQFTIINDYLNSNHILIKSESISNSFREVFENIWNLSN